MSQSLSLALSEFPDDSKFLPDLSLRMNQSTLDSQVHWTNRPKCLAYKTVTANHYSKISIAGSPPSMQWKWYFGSLKKSKWQIVSILTEVGMFRCGLAGLVRRVNISAALSRHWLQCFQDRQKEVEDGADLEFGTTGITSRTSALLFQSGQNFTS